MSATSKLRRPLVLVLTAGALAVGVPAAIAAGNSADDGGGGAGGGTAAPQPRLVQDQPRQRPDGDDCPEHDGDRGAGSDSGSGEGSTTTTPSL